MKSAHQTHITFGIQGERFPKKLLSNTQFTALCRVLTTLSLHADIFQIAKQKAFEGERGRRELEEANKELLLIGELQLKYQERLEQLTALKKAEEELELFKDACKEDNKGKYNGYFSYFFHVEIDF